MTRTKQNWIVYSQVLLACVIFLTGCTARELEERRLPLALEVDAKDMKDARFVWAEDEV